MDPDFHRRDLADGIETGAFFEYELGVQVLPDDGSDSFEGIDLLDPTKLVPEELAPVQLIGKMTLNRNPTNFSRRPNRWRSTPGTWCGASRLRMIPSCRHASSPTSTPS